MKANLLPFVFKKSRIYVLFGACFALIAIIYGVISLQAQDRLDVFLRGYFSEIPTFFVYVPVLLLSFNVVGAKLDNEMAFVRMQSRLHAFYARTKLLLYEAVAFWAIQCAVFIAACLVIGNGAPLPVPWETIAAGVLVQLVTVFSVGVAYVALSRVLMSARTATAIVLGMLLLDFAGTTVMEFNMFFYCAPMKVLSSLTSIEDVTGTLVFLIFFTLGKITLFLLAGHYFISRQRIKLSRTYDKHMLRCLGGSLLAVPIALFLTGVLEGRAPATSSLLAGAYGNVASLESFNLLTIVVSSIPLLFQLYFFSDLFGTDFNTAAVFVFTRKDSRIKWLAQKSLQLIVYSYLFYFLQFVVVTAIGLTRSFVLDFQNTMEVVGILSLTTVLCNTLLVFIANVLSIRMKASSVVSAIIACFSCWLLFLPGIYRLGAGIVMGFPLSQGILSIHELPPYLSGLFENGIPGFSVGFSILYLLIACLTAFLISCFWIKKTDLIQSSY
jgi:hypothetical protein